MAKGIDELIEFLLAEIALCGVQGTYSTFRSIYFVSFLVAQCSLTARVVSVILRVIPTVRFSDVIFFIFCANQECRGR